MNEILHNSICKNTPNQVKLEFLSRSENVALARLLAAAMAAEKEISLAELDEIKVAVSEAVSNAIIHGYQGKSDCLVTLMLTMKEKRLTISVHDDGIGIQDIEQAMKPNFSSHGDRMGLGFAFMHSFMDVVEVSSLPGEGTTVVMHKDFL